MRKILCIVILFFIAASAIAQGGWTRPNNSYGPRQNRIAVDSTLFYPTGCGNPTLKAYDLKQSALYFDTCNVRFWIYNPKTASWDTVHMGVVSAGTPDLQEVLDEGSTLSSSEDIISDQYNFRTKFGGGSNPNFWMLSGGAGTLNDANAWLHLENTGATRYIDAQYYYDGYSFTQVYDAITNTLSSNNGGWDISSGSTTLYVAPSEIGLISDAIYFEVTDSTTGAGYVWTDVNGDGYGSWQPATGGGGLVTTIQSIATAGGTTTLTAASVYHTYFTGTSPQDLQLPDATTLSDGHRYKITNASSNFITIRNNASLLVYQIAPETSIDMYLISNGSTNGTWGWDYNGVTYGSAGIAAKFQSSMEFAGGSGAIMTMPTANATIAATNIAQTWTAGIKPSFDANATNADIRLIGYAGDPSTLSNGDMWYNSSTHEFRGRANGASITLGGAGGSQDLQDVTDIGNITTNDIYLKHLFVEGDGTTSEVWVTDQTQTEGWVIAYNDINKKLRFASLDNLSIAPFELLNTNEIDMFGAFSPNYIHFSRTGLTFFNSGEVSIGSGSDQGAYLFQVTGSSIFNGSIYISDLSIPGTPPSGTIVNFVNSDRPGFLDDNGNEFRYSYFKESSITSSATPTPTGYARINDFYVTALATNPTFSAPSGTPVNGNRLLIRIKDDGTIRSLFWNAIYRAGDLTLPTATVTTKTLYVGFIYNSATSTWDLEHKGENFWFYPIFLIGTIVVRKRKEENLKQAA